MQVTLEIPQTINMLLSWKLCEVFVLLKFVSQKKFVEDLKHSLEEVVLHQKGLIQLKDA
jgi:hypothetical protein